MSYFPQGATQLVARNAYSSMDGWWDDVKGGASSVLDFFGKSKQTAGALSVHEQQAAAAAAAAGQKPGLPSWAIPAAIGGGVLLLLVMRKK